jgi:hypothetical protein
MIERVARPRALFLFPDEPPQPDDSVCSGEYGNWLGGLACPYSDAGRMPRPGTASSGPASAEPLGETDLGERLEGWPEGERAPPCVVAVLGRLSDWRGEQALRYPPAMGERLLLKCRQMFLLVLINVGEG